LNYSPNPFKIHAEYGGPTETPRHERFQLGAARDSIDDGRNRDAEISLAHSAPPEIGRVKFFV
jgi:hypothetical protein